MFNFFKNAITNKENSIAKNKKYDKDFILKIQPKFNMIFKENYIKSGNGYETCIHITDYPERVNTFWIKTLTDLDIDNTITTIDVSTMNEAVLESNIEKSLKESEDRIYNDKSISSKIKSRGSFSKDSSLVSDLSNSKLTIKLVHIRMFLTADTLNDLETKSKKILNYLNGKKYTAGIYLNELEDEFKSFYNPYYTQSTEFLTKRKGKEIRSDSLGAGIDYHFSELNDTGGVYYGSTFTGGAVIFNPFYKDTVRKSYNGILIGNMGSGKSTFLKKMANTQYILGNKVRCFDASGEFKFLVDKAKGKIINLNNAKNILNPLQVYKSNYINTDEDGKFENSNLSSNEIDNKFYQNHLSKLGIFLNYYAPDLDSDCIDEFTNILDDFYFVMGFYKYENNIKVFNNLTTRDNLDYPILSDLLNFIEDLYKNEDDEFRKKRIDKIKLKIKKLVNINGILFNGHSTLNIHDEDFVVFNIKELAKLSNEVFSSVIFNILSLLWEEMMNNVNIEKTGNSIENQNLQTYSILIDEAHRILNDSINPKTLEFFTDFQREMRKYLGGIWFSYHTLDDAIKDVDTDSKINQIFNLSQYKVIFSQDTRLEDKFVKVFKGSITSSEVKKISSLGIGECLLCTGGNQNILFKVSLGLEEEKRLIATGGK